MSIMMDFDAYFGGVWGARWPKIRAAVLAEKRYRALLPRPECATEPYYLDEASARVAESLRVRPGERVLDLCAAPGGKSLVLLDALQGEGLLYVNDKERAARLRRVLEQYGVLADCSLSGADGTTLWKRYPDFFDAILVDAPCSSEAHWLRDGGWEQHWRLSRPKRLAITQYALLASALMMLRPGGRVLYATCALNPLENEAVVEKALTRWGDRIVCETCTLPEAEPARYGSYYLPDQGVGGPLYACLLRRLL